MGKRREEKRREEKRREEKRREERESEGARERESERASVLFIVPAKFCVRAVDEARLRWCGSCDCAGVTHVRGCKRSRFAPSSTSTYSSLPGSYPQTTSPASDQCVFRRRDLQTIALQK